MPRNPAERLRVLCLALPDATEAPMRRGPTYRIANKIFAMERPQDDAFLFELFVSHAGRPLRQGGLPDAAVAQLMAIQYRAQTGAYRAQFSDAVYSVIESDGVMHLRYREKGHR